jgi:hypothetical protein
MQQDSSRAEELETGTDSAVNPIGSSLVSDRSPGSDSCNVNEKESAHDAQKQPAASKHRNLATSLTAQSRF